MKNLSYILCFVFVVCSTFVLSAQSNRSGRNDRHRDREAKAKMKEETFEQPCMRYDDDEYFAASGYVRVKVGGEGERDYSIVATKLLDNLRQQVKQKIGGKYQSVVRDYFNQMDVDDKFSASSHIESAGEQIIDTYLNHTEEDCRQIGNTDESGYANLYIGILVRKVDLVDAIIDGMEESEEVPAEVKNDLRANEKAFRESAFKVFEAKPVEE